MGGTYVTSLNGAQRPSALRSPGAPWDWEVDDQGRPTWIPALPGLAWGTAFDWEFGFGIVYRLQMPRISEGGGDAATGAGDEGLARRAAGLRDVYRCSHEYIARQLHMPCDGGRAELRGVAKARVREGRALLLDAGILPWAAFRTGPPKRWWREEAFVAALREWQLTAAPDADQGLVTRFALQAAGLAARVPVEVLHHGDRLVRETIDRVPSRVQRRVRRRAA